MSSARRELKKRKFMSILEQLPRICSPTICGTLSQPTTKAEMASCSENETFEWSLEQKALLSPANITTDEWQNPVELNTAWRVKESEQFFSQRIIAPSPLITPRTTHLRRPFRHNLEDILCEDDEDEGELLDERYDRRRIDNNCAMDSVEKVREQYHDTNNQQDNLDIDDSNRMAQDPSVIDYNEDDDELFRHRMFRVRDYGELGTPTISAPSVETATTTTTTTATSATDRGASNDDLSMEGNDFIFSPALRSSQSQQTMEIFSPETFSSVMEDENTIQSTPKSTAIYSVRKSRSFRRPYELDYNE